MDDYSLLHPPRRSLTRSQGMVGACMLVSLGFLLYGTVALVNGVSSMHSCMDMIVTNTQSMCEVLRTLSPNNPHMSCVGI